MVWRNPLLQKLMTRKFQKNYQCLLETNYSRMDQLKFLEESLKKIWSDLVCLNRSCHFRFCKSCIPQISHGPFLNTLFHSWVKKVNIFLPFEFILVKINAFFCKEVLSATLSWLTSVSVGHFTLLPVYFYLMLGW